MRKHVLRTILTCIVLIGLLVTACADKKTGIDSDFKNRITPSEGYVWPPQSLRKAFGIEGLTQHEGIEDVYYYSQSGVWITPIGRTSEDRLDIDFEVSTQESVDFFYEYFDSSDFVGEIYKSGSSFNAEIWKTGNNILYFIDSYISSWGGWGYLELMRIGGTNLHFGWPTKARLRSFDIEDLPKPPTINNQYYYFVEDLEFTGLFSRFAGVTAEDALAFREYFESIAEGSAWDYSGSFQRVDENYYYYYYYRFNINDDKGLGYLEIYKEDIDDEYFSPERMRQKRDIFKDFYYQANTADGVRITDDRFEDHPMISPNARKERINRSER